MLLLLLYTVDAFLPSSRRLVECVELELGCY